MCLLGFRGHTSPIGGQIKKEREYAFSSQPRKKKLKLYRIIETIDRFQPNFAQQ